MASEYLDEKKFYVFFGTNREAFIYCFKVLSKEAHQQIKKWNFFIRELDLSEFLLDFDGYYMKKYPF